MNEGVLPAWPGGSAEDSGKPGTETALQRERGRDKGLVLSVHQPLGLRHHPAASAAAGACLGALESLGKLSPTEAQGLA